MTGRLGPETEACLERRYASAGRGADGQREREQISRVLLADAVASGDDAALERLVERHLREAEPRWPVTPDWEDRILIGTICDDADEEALRAALEAALASGVPCATPPPPGPVGLKITVDPGGRVVEDPAWFGPDLAWYACLRAVVVPLALRPARGGAPVWIAKIPVSADSPRWPAAVIEWSRHII
jgi:hypothetical protein